MSDPRTAPPPRAQADAPPTAASSQPAGKPLQYSMRSLMIVVTLVAVVAAMLPYQGVTSTLLLIGLVALLFVGPVCLGTLALYSRGQKQTFFLGAFAGSLSSFYLSNMLLRFGGDLAAILALCVVSAAASAACGLAALFTRRFLERRGWHLLPNREDSPRGDKAP